MLENKVLNKVLKAALKQRIYKRGDHIKRGDWIYYKNKDKWEGPVKVAAKDGKSLFAVRGGRLLTINTDHAHVAMFEGEFLGESATVDVEPVEKHAQNSQEKSNNLEHEVQNRNKTDAVIQNRNETEGLIQNRNEAEVVIPNRNEAEVVITEGEVHEEDESEEVRDETPMQWKKLPMKMNQLIINW